MSEAHPAPLLSKGGSSVYVIFDKTMKKLTKIKVFLSGGESISAAFRTLLASTHFTYKALSQRSCPHTPQQNGVAERKHRHILETARSLLLSASVPSPFWAEAVCSDCHIFFEPNTFLCHLWSVFFFLRADFLPRLTMKSFESIGGGCGGNPRGAASSRAGRPAV